MSKLIQDGLERNALFVFLIVLIMIDIHATELALTHAATTYTEPPKNIEYLQHVSTISLDTYWFRVFIGIKSAILYTIAFTGKNYFTVDRKP